MKQPIYELDGPPPPHVSEEKWKHPAMKLCSPGMRQRFGMSLVLTPEGHPYELPHDGDLRQEGVNKFLAKDPYCFHPKGSPYLGLSVKEQFKLRKKRWHDNLVDRDYSKQEAVTDEEYHVILNACLDVLVSYHGKCATMNKTTLSYVRMVLRVPKNFKYHYGNLGKYCSRLAVDDTTFVIAVKCVNVIDWMYERNKCAFNSTTIRQHLKSLVQEQDRIGFLKEYTSATQVVNGVGNILNEAVRISKKNI